MLKPEELKKELDECSESRQGILFSNISSLAVFDRLIKISTELVERIEALEKRKECKCCQNK